MEEHAIGSADKVPERQRCLQGFDRAHSARRTSIELTPRATSYCRGPSIDEQPFSISMALFDSQVSGPPFPWCSKSLGLALLGPVAPNRIAPDSQVNMTGSNQGRVRLEESPGGGGAQRAERTRVDEMGNTSEHVAASKSLRLVLLKVTRRASSPLWYLPVRLLMDAI